MEEGDGSLQEEVEKVGKKIREVLEEIDRRGRR